MPKTFLTACTTLTIAVGGLSSGAAIAGGGDIELKQRDWPFEGAFGTVDRTSAQRGYQVYSEVCSGCHAMKYKSFRNLADLGFSEGEIKTISAEYDIEDGPNDDGDMFERPGRPSDSFPDPFPNEKAAAAANGGAIPPDLSLITKARVDGPNYIYSLMTGYKKAPEGTEVVSDKYWNAYFSGHWIAMPPQLSEGIVTYGDGTEATEEQMAIDLVNFLQWAAEPEMEHRKGMGLKVLAFLAIFTILFYLTKRRIWSDVK